MGNDYIFDIPIDNTSLIIYANRHFENPIDFSTNGVRCPDLDCPERPFPDSEILFLHILFHKELLYVCGFCPLGFGDENLLTDHYENEHSETNKLKEHLELTVNTRSLLTEKWTKLPVQPSFVGTPTTCNYNENATLIMVCKFPQTGEFITGEFDVTETFQTCFNGDILNKMVQCPFLNKETSDCQLEFETCRELVLHISTHFDCLGVCIHCPKYYGNVESLRSHKENQHNECTKCGLQFGCLQNLKGHKSEIDTLCLPYKINSPEIDLNCSLFLPNLAFHHTRLYMTNIDYELACIENHDCVNLSRSLKLHVYDVPTKQGNSCIRFCLTNEVIKYSDRQECDFTENCTFKYRRCRELLVHTLMTHTMLRNYTYICSICHIPYPDKNLLRMHIYAIHRPKHFCSTCLMSFDSDLKLALHQFSIGHIPKR